MGVSCVQKLQGKIHFYIIWINNRLLFLQFLRVNLDHTHHWGGIALKEQCTEFNGCTFLLCLILLIANKCKQCIFPAPHPCEQPAGLSLLTNKMTMLSSSPLTVHVKVICWRISQNLLISIVFLDSINPTQSKHSTCVSLFRD